MVDPEGPRQPEDSVRALRANLLERTKELGFLQHAAHLLDMRGESRDILRAASAKQLKLSAELEPVGSLLGDQQRLQQVVYNLLGNAVRFTPAGGSIHVTLHRTGSRAVLRVRDTGVGIDGTLLPHVFERFRQADAAKKGRNSGLGLGLPIARHLVELHQGTISVHSQPPEPGTTFEIQLPLDA